MGVLDQHITEVDGQEHSFDKTERVPLGVGEPAQLVDQHQVKLVCFRDEFLHTGAVDVAPCDPTVR